MTGPLGLDTLKWATLQAVLKLAGREVAIKALGFCGSIGLARLLDPVDFGLFGISLFALHFFSLFGQLGLAAALIRRPEPISEPELQTIFSFQLVWVTALTLAFCASAPLVAILYDAPALPWLIVAMSLALWISALRTVPTILLERSLAYGRLAFADVAGQIAYWAAAITAAAAGLHVWSLVVSLSLSSALTTAILYWRTTWRPRLLFDWNLARQSLAFGLAFQGQSFAHFVKDSMIPSLGGIAYGATAVGYLSWAQQLSSTPLQLTHVVARVSFPVLSRLQHDAREVGRMADFTLAWTARISFPFFATIVGLAPQIVNYVYATKWLPALPALYFLSANMVIGVLTGVLMPILYTCGRVNTALMLSVGWAILSWATALALHAVGVGFTGLAIAYAFATFVASVAITLCVKRMIPLRVLPALRLPIVSGATTALALNIFGVHAVSDLLSLIVTSLVAIAGALLVNVAPTASKWFLINKTDTIRRAQ